MNFGLECPHMTESFRNFAGTLVAASLTFGAAHAQSSNPICPRLEAQLASLDRGNTDPARVEQIRRTEDMVNRQQYEVDRMVTQSRQIGQQRNALERMRNDLERLNGGTAERAAQRRGLLIALGDNGCGPQYRAAALAGQQGGFWDRLFGDNGGGSVVSTPLGPMGGTFRTVCVRTWEGFYFPISYSTSPDRFSDDEMACQRMCPASEVSLYTYHNPGEEMAQAASLNGRPYSELPTAFQYRKSMSPECSCRRPGESWAQTLKAIGPDDTVVRGDFPDTEQNAKQLSQQRVEGKPIPQDQRTYAAEAEQTATSPNAEASGQTDPTKRSVRTVGPTFWPAR